MNDRTTTPAWVQTLGIIAGLLAATGGAAVAGLTLAPDDPLSQCAPICQQAGDPQ